MAEEEPKPLNYIPEVILKKRKSNEQWAIRRKLQLEQRTRKNKGDNFVIKKPEQFIKDFRDRVIASIFSSLVFVNSGLGFLPVFMLRGIRHNLQDYSIFGGIRGPLFCGM